MDKTPQKNIILISKDNPFAVVSASSNRYIGLLIGLNNIGWKVNILITGGYFNKNEKQQFKVAGQFKGLEYEYLNTYSNTTLNKRRFYEYFLRRIIFFKTRRVFFNKMVRINTTKIIWIRTDIINFKIVNSIKDPKNFKFFMEINEFPDIHLTNNSIKYPWQKLLANTTSEYLHNIILKKLDGLAVITQNLEFYFRPLCNPKTKIINLPMTVEIQRFQLGEIYPNIQNLKTPYIAFIGAMSDSKDGVSILIESFVKIAEEFPQYNLVLFGFWAYDTKKHLRLIKESNLDNRVIYREQIDSKEIVNLIMNSSLLVLPRPDSEQARGGFPTKLGEYLASSKPVISTKVGEIPNFLEDRQSVFFCEPNSVESLTETIRFVLQNAELSKTVGLNGRKVSEQVFCSQVQARRLDDFLGEL